MKAEVLAGNLRAALRCGRPRCPCQKPGPEGLTHCPAHADDTPSLSVEERGGKILVHCHAGCSQDAVLAALRTRGLWPQVGVTLQGLCAARQLSPELLRGLGVHDVRLRSGPAVAIPYYDTDGQEVAVRYRIALTGDRFRWREGSKVLPYGLWMLENFRPRRWVLVVEGETDCWTAWQEGIPAVGIPGKSTWRGEWARYFDGLEVFLWQEPDAPDLAAKIAQDLPGVRVIAPPHGIKDLSEAHTRGLDVRELVEQLRTTARTAHEIAREAQDVELVRLREAIRPVLEHRDPLALFAESARAMGYAGDLRPALIAYLAATTRLLSMRAGQMPAHTCLVGPSSAGKSFTWNVVRSHLPDEAVVEIEAGSPRVLIYKQADLRHKVTVFAEVDSLPRGEDNPAASAVRHLLQEHRLKYEVVERDAETGEHYVRSVERQGPTLLVTTAVRAPGGQLATRLFLLPVPDDESRLREVLEAQGRLEEEGSSHPNQLLRDYQTYLQKLAPWDVFVPFARPLARLLGRSIVGPRVLRDFQRLLALVKATALIRHQHRERDPRGRIVATLEDYATARDLVREMYEVSATGASNLVRDVVRAVQQAKDEGQDRVTYGEVARRLGIHREQARRAADVALRNGWLVNRAPDRKGAWAALEPGDPLPDRVGLPTPEEVASEWGVPPDRGGNGCDVVTFGPEARFDATSGVTANVTPSGTFDGPPVTPAPGEGAERQMSQTPPHGCDVWVVPEPLSGAGFGQTSQRHTAFPPDGGDTGGRTPGRPGRTGAPVGGSGATPTSGTGLTREPVPSGGLTRDPVPSGGLTRDRVPMGGLQRGAPGRMWRVRADAPQGGLAGRASPPATPCPTCGGIAWWYRPPSQGGGWVCSRCHPPVGDTLGPGGG